MKNFTIQDVAREAGVSITTVSRVINGNYPVRAQTRQKVEKAVQKLNFTPNVLARGLIQRKTYTIGVLVPSISNLFFSVVVNGIQDFFKNKDYQIMMCNTQGEQREEEKYLAQLLERQVDGLISIDPRTAVIQNGSYEKAAQKTPLILINGYNDGVKLNFVLNDQEAGWIEAFEYLIRLGHKKIGFIRGGHSHSYDLKEQVYRRMLEKYKIPFRAGSVAVIEKGNSTQTLDMAKEALQEILSKEDRPSAILACNDWMGIGAVYAARQLKIDVPGALSVIGCDNTVISEISMPKLTTVDQNMYALGMTTASELFHIMEGGGREGYIRIVMDTKLVIRESCAVNMKGERI